MRKAIHVLLSEREAQELIPAILELAPERAAP